MLSNVRSVILTAETAKNATEMLEMMDEQSQDHEPEGKFEDAPEVRAVAVDLMNREQTKFGHLAEAKIAYLFRTGDWKSKGRNVMGKAYVMDERQRFVSGIDLQVVINHDVWEQADETQREALVAHELCHFERQDDDKHGNPRWRSADHDLEEFNYIVRKYGLVFDDLHRFMESHQTGEVERRQGTMFDEESA